MEPSWLWVQGCWIERIRRLGKENCKSHKRPITSSQQSQDCMDRSGSKESHLSLRLSMAVVGNAQVY